MRYLVAILIILLYSCAEDSEKPFDCDAFLSQRIFISDHVNTDSLFSEFQKFKKCGLSEKDAEYLLTGPILGTAMVELANEGKSDITYKDMLDKILEYKKALNKAK